MVVLLLIVGVVAKYHRWAAWRWSAPSGSATNLLLGNPSHATADPADANNLLLVKPYFALSYNDSTGEPNWVSWVVSPADLGEAPRKGEFDADSTLPPGFHMVSEHEYSGSGFDRGHMCPHGDRTANTEMSFATFVMTNIIPQAPNVNRKAWAQLEVYCRELVRSGHRLYIVAGPDGRGGTGSRGFASSLRDGKVVVPAECWKIVVVLPGAGGDDVSRLTGRERVISVEMPNDNDKVGEEWDKFRVAAAQVEQRTGYKFFDKLPPDIAHQLEIKIDTQYIAPPRPLSHEPD